MTSPKIRLLFLPLFALLASTLTATAGGASYGVAELHIKEVMMRKNGDVRITFQPMAESVYFCPGANAKVTPKGMELTFVRAWFKKRPKVDHPASFVKGKAERVLTVPAKGKPVFVRDGKKLVKLEVAVNWK